MGIFSALSGGFKLITKMMGFLFMKKAVEGSILKKDMKQIKKAKDVKKNIARSSSADRRKRMQRFVKPK
tara:strand:- start:2322 stop:2528 length:207 start_codon:yes stop_codon:yes gene_type:complete